MCAGWVRNSWQQWPGRQLTGAIYWAPTKRWHCGLQWGLQQSILLLLVHPKQIWNRWVFYLLFNVQVFISLLKYNHNWPLTVSTSYYRLCWLGKPSYDLLFEQPSADTVYDSWVQKCALQVRNRPHKSLCKCLYWSCMFSSTVKTPVNLSAGSLRSLRRILLPASPTSCRGCLFFCRPARNGPSKPRMWRGALAGTAVRVSICTLLCSDYVSPHGAFIDTFSCSQPGSSMISRSCAG